jgi:hypothetical protein
MKSPFYQPAHVPEGRAGEDIIAHICLIINCKEERMPPVYSWSNRLFRALYLSNAAQICIPCGKIEARAPLGLPRVAI